MEEKINSEDEIILWYLSRTYHDLHPYIYLYVCGQERSKKTSTRKINKEIFKLFDNCYPQWYLLAIINLFLKNKEIDYKKGKIVVKPLY